MNKIITMVALGAIALTAVSFRSDAGPPEVATTTVVKNNNTGHLATASDHGLVNLYNADFAFATVLDQAPAPTVHVDPGSRAEPTYMVNCEERVIMSDRMESGAYNPLSVEPKYFDLKSAMASVTGQVMILDASTFVPRQMFAEHTKELRAQWQWSYAPRPVYRC